MEKSGENYDAHTQFSKLSRINSIFGGELQYWFTNFNIQTFFLRFRFCWRTIGIFVFFKTIKRTTETNETKLNEMSQSCWFLQKYQMNKNTYQYSSHREHLYFLVSSEHSGHVIVLFDVLMVIKIAMCVKSKQENNVRMKMSK